LVIGKYPVDINQLLKMTIEKKGSDLHLVAGVPPHIRIFGELVRTDLPPLRPKDIETMLEAILNDKQKENLYNEWELDFSYSIPGLSRFRGNVMFQRNSLGVNFRVIPFEIPEISALGLPAGVEDLCDLSRGLVLVTGPTGSGKSTTLAAMVNYINETKNVNIITLEDPIEFLHNHKKSIVHQREVGTDTHSFADALRHILRHDPDVILVGEMRDLDSISIALTAAETGHLVLSTLHTQTAALTVSRIIDVFHDSRREQVRQQLANSLKAVIAQQLVPKKDGSGRVAAVEFMLGTPAIRSMIREGKEHQLYSAIQTGHTVGMQTMDQALARLYLRGEISRQHALEYSIDPKEVERLLNSPR